jgi:RNA polymerase sigma-70 factor (ECF subfamily)
MVSRAIRGDADAFEALVREYSKTILYQARRYIRHPDEAEDAAQEAVIAMYESIHTLRKPEAFRSWMYRLVKFVCLKHIRDLSARRGGQDAGDIDDYADSLASDRREEDPSLSAEDRERSAQILRIIGTLPEKQREALVLHYYDGLSYREIAKAIGSTTSTVSTNILKAKRKIVRELEPALAMAIAMDAHSKLAGIDLTAFHAHAMAGVAAAGSAAAAVGAGAGAAGAGATTGAAGGATGASSGGAGASGAANTQHGQIVGAAAAVAAAGVVTALVLSGGDGAASPVAEAPGAVAAVEQIAAEIVFEGGECACGHLNPKDEQLVIHTEGATAREWTMLKDGEVFRTGEGRELWLNPESLEEGDYVIRYVVTGADGGKATVERAFAIRHGDYDAADYD